MKDEFELGCVKYLDHLEKQIELFSSQYYIIYDRCFKVFIRSFKIIECGFRFDEKYLGMIGDLESFSFRVHFFMSDGESVTVELHKGTFFDLEAYRFLVKIGTLLDNILIGRSEKYER